jgi:hypothetical protein
MSALNGHPGDENPAELSQRKADTKERIYAILQDFEVLPSRFERYIFKHIYIYVLGLYFVAELILLLDRLNTSSSVDAVDLLWIGASVFSAVGILSVPWTFNVWRRSVPKTLRDLVEKRRIYTPARNTAQSYLLFLQSYRSALADRRRHLLGVLPLLIVSILTASDVAQNTAVFETLLSKVGYLLYFLGLLGGLYCFGRVTWTAYVSGWYVRSLVRAFDFRIQPFHSDKCGGLKQLGNFCFNLASPLLFGSGVCIGSIGLSLINRPESEPTFWAVNIGTSLLFLLVYFAPGIVLAFMFPVWEIHTKMVSEGETDEDSYVGHIEELREEIQTLLATNKIKEAQGVQEKKALVEALHAPYPEWPFKFHSKIPTTVLGVTGSLLIGVAAAALQQHFLPAILKPLLQK